MINRREIIERIERNRNRIKDFGVRELGIFGSVARGENMAESDVDVLVEMEHPTFRSYMGLLFFLEEIFGTKVDLVIKGDIKPRIKKRILSEAVYVEGF